MPKKSRKKAENRKLLSFIKVYVHPLTAHFSSAIMHGEEGVVGAEKRGWINILRVISGSALIDET